MKEIKRLISMPILIIELILCICTITANQVESKNTILPRTVEVYSQVMEVKDVRELEEVKELKGNSLSLDIEKEITYEYKIGYISATNVNLRSEPNTDSNIIKVLRFNSEVKYADYNDDWYIINHNDNKAYIKKGYISENKVGFKRYEAPRNAIKTYMNYTMITATNTPQYKLQNTIAYDGNYGIRQVNGRYCVAIGSYYATKIGTYFDLVLENGTIMPCILADQKDDKHTDSSNRITMHDGSLTEFVVNTNNMSNKVKNITGDISYSCNEFNSPVKEIIVYDKVEVF